MPLPWCLYPLEKVRLSTVWEPSIPGVLVKNRTSFENQKVDIIKNYASLCDESNIPVKVLSLLYTFNAAVRQSGAKLGSGVMQLKKREFAKGVLAFQ